MDHNENNSIIIITSCSIFFPETGACYDWNLTTDPFHSDVDCWEDQTEDECMNVIGGAFLEDESWSEVCNSFDLPTTNCTIH